MGKTVYKVVPYAWFEREQLSHWLSLQAAEGFIIRNICIGIGEFEKGSPASRQYVIGIDPYKFVKEESTMARNLLMAQEKPDMQKPLTKEGIERVREQEGWKFLASNGQGNYLLYQAITLNPKPLPPCPLTEKQLLRQQIGSSIWGMLFLMWSFFYQQGDFWPQEILPWTDSSFLLNFFMRALMLLLLLGNGINLLLACQYCGKNKTKKISIPLRQGYKKVYLASWGACLLALAVLMIGACRTGLSFEEEAAKMRFPLWQDIAPQEYQIDLEKHIYLVNEIRLETTILAPVVQKVYQNQWFEEDEAESWHKSYGVTRYQLYSTAHAARLAQELCLKYAQFDGPLYPITQQDTQFSFAVYGENQGNQRLVLQKENIVLDVCYTGQQQLNRFLDLYQEKWNKHT